MEKLAPVQDGITQGTETLKRTLVRWRRDRWKRLMPQGGGPEPRWRKILLRTLIGVGIVLLASGITYTFKPAWWTSLKGRFSSRATAPVVKKKTLVQQRPRPAVKAVTTPATHIGGTTPTPQQSTPIAKKLERPQVVIPGRVVRPQVAPPQSGESPQPQVAPPQSGESPQVTALPPRPPKAEDKEIDDYLEIGVLYAQKERYEKAGELFQKVLKENPSSPQAHNNLGVVYLKQGKYDLAEKAFKESLTIDPASSLPYYNLACLYSRKGMEVEALIYLKKALTRDERVKLWAMTDEDFEKLRSDVVFQELLGISPPQQEGAQKKEGVQKQEGAQKQEGVQEQEGAQKQEGAQEHPPQEDAQVDTQPDTQGVTTE